MRIRQRKTPFPLSSLSPGPLLPLSDPNSTGPSPIQQLQEDDDDGKDQHKHPPAGGSQDSSYYGFLKREEKKVLLQEEKLSNDIRGGNFFMGAPIMGFQESSTSSHQADGTLCEGEEAILMENDKQMMKTKMKTIKKCMKPNPSMKKRVRGGQVMEGSRCSRVNGRGWRCCQQTLVGYSLCDHHLGKGRLRSMTSVRSRSVSNSTAPPKKSESRPLLSCISASLMSAVEEDEKDILLLDNKVKLHGNEEDLSFTKKKPKLGMVKARSMSSLLGQAADGSHGIQLVENDYELTSRWTKTENV
ncbi:uncharacterized protein LOC126676448 [Mercurialis annua]|uniref:uncharacterized protein LOC126676448 n=1 Tax=Mercurialis annua TaxID=3986 RepID=UPI00215F15B3|nr:uncharacterized protein LOC126676448 [Mercurialis annua]